MIKTGGELHYYINGLDQGIAATTVPSPVWAVVDLYGMTVKVSGLPDKLGVSTGQAKNTWLLMAFMGLKFSVYCVAIFLHFSIFSELSFHPSSPPQVTIVERDEREEQNLITRRNTQMGDTNSTLTDAGK